MTITRYGNPNAQHGLALIVGTKFVENGQDAGRFAAVDAALKQNTALNIMMIDFEDAPYDQPSLTKNLAAFMAENSWNTVINGIHGSQIAYGTDHYSVIGPAIEDSYLSFLGESVVNFLHGNSVWSASLLQAIGDAAKGTPLDVWQFSCQGAKLLDHAQHFLPQGSHYVAESEGFIRPEIFLNAFVQTLNSNQDFTFDDLYKDYLATTAKLSSSLGFGMMDPVKVTIGETPVKAIAQGDQLIAEVRAKTVDTAKFETALEAHCERVAAAEVTITNKNWHPYYNQHTKENCMSEGKSAVMQVQFMQDKTNAACVNVHNQRDFITTTLLDLVNDLLPGPDALGLYEYPDLCLAGNIGSFSSSLFDSVAEHYYSDI